MDFSLAASRGNRLFLFSRSITDSSAATGTPLGNLIDDDGISGPDYPSNTAGVVCESCHSPHRKGDVAKNLRITADAGALCVNCHGNK